MSPVAPRPHESLAAAADAAVNALHALAASAGVLVSTEIDPTAATLPAGDLFTVIHNGLSNAIQACAGSDAGDRRVALSIRSLSGRGLEIAIVDTGPGLPSGWTIDGVPRPDGHGLGLVLARRVCRAHGGSLTISNVPFAGGAVFRAVVPLSGLASAA